MLYHLAAVGVANLPGPTSFRPELLDTATARAQLAWLSAAARRLGFDLDEPGARALVLAAAPRMIGARKALLWPFEPYQAHLGVRQPWRLFAFVDREAASLQIDASFGGEFLPLYRRLDPANAWRAAQLDHERSRSLLASITSAPGYHAYRPFAAWLAARAFEDFPEATAVRFRVERLSIPPPGDGAAPGPPEYEQELVFERPRNLPCGPWRRRASGGGGPPSRRGWPSASRRARRRRSGRRWGR